MFKVEGNAFYGLVVVLPCFTLIVPIHSGCQIQPLNLREIVNNIGELSQLLKESDYSSLKTETAAFNLLHVSPSHQRQ